MPTKTEPDAPTDMPDFVLIDRNVLHTLSLLLCFQRQKSDIVKQFCLMQIPTVADCLHAIACPTVSPESVDVAHNSLKALTTMLESATGEIDCAQLARKPGEKS